MAHCFIGRYDLTLDDKCRMRLPAKLRSAIGTGYVIIYGEGCLTVLPKEDFSVLNEKFSAIPFSDVAARRVVSLIMSSALEPEEDAQGRFVLPLHARNHAGIAKNVVVAGAGPVIEIWSEEAYTLSRADSGSFEDKLGKLSAYGI